MYEFSNRLQDLFCSQKRFPILNYIYKVAKCNHIILLKNVKPNYYLNKILTSNNQSPTPWSIINSANDSRKHNHYINLMIDDTQISNLSTMAESFNDFFVTKLQ